MDAKAPTDLVVIFHKIHKLNEFTVFFTVFVFRTSDIDETTMVAHSSVTGVAEGKFVYIFGKVMMARLWRKGVVESALAGAKSIAISCVKAKTVKKLIYTSTIIAASPLKEDGSGYKDFVDETCWTPLDLSTPYGNQFLETYRDSKTLSEKEILRLGKENGGELEVVTIGCGLVGGDSLLTSTPNSVSVIISQLTHNEAVYNMLMYIEELLGKVPLVHIEDACEAHIFCFETPSLQGRALLASSYVSSSDMTCHFRRNHPRFPLNEEYFNGADRKIEWTSKLIDKGFVYKFDFKKILDDSIECAEKRGYLK